MEINKIREIESNNWDKIHWFKSGIFWRAYNVSAYLTVQELRSFKVIHKHFKKVKWDVAYLGFPDAVYTSMLETLATRGLAIKSDQADHTIIAVGKIVTQAVLADWLASMQKENVLSTSKGFKQHEKYDLLERIKNFPLALRTPLESQQFLWSIQRELDGTL